MSFLFKKFFRRPSVESNTSSTLQTLDDSPPLTPTMHKYGEYVFDEAIDDYSSSDDHDYSLIHGKDEVVGTIQSDPQLDHNVDAVLRQYVHISERAKLKRIYGTFSEAVPLVGHDDVVTKLFKIDSERVLSISDDSSLIIWRIPIAQSLKLLGHEKKVTCACIIQNRNDGTRKTWIVSGSSDKSIRVWDANTGNCIFNLKKHSSGVSHIFDLGENRFCSISDEICVWKIVDELNPNVQLEYCIARTDEESVYSALVLPNHRILIASSYLSVYRTDEDLESITLEEPPQHYSEKTYKTGSYEGKEDIFAIIRITPESFITACRNGVIAFWSESSLHYYDTINIVDFLGEKGKEENNMFRYITLLNGYFLGCCYGRHFVIINYDSKQPVLIKTDAHEGNINKIEYIPHRNCLVTCSDDAKLKIWDTFMTLSFQSHSQSPKFATSIESRRGKRSNSNATPFQVRRRSQSVDLRPALETDPSTKAPLSKQIDTLSAHSYPCVDIIRMNDYEIVSAGGNDLIIWRDDVYASTIRQLYSWRYSTSIYNEI